MFQKTPTDERGFALLVVMLMAATIAFALYTQVPRFAFESMREKEQLLMDRGNQYKRAIQLFYAVNKHYPARMEDLENTNDKRFLRRRYRDPMTGSDEWRLIHTNGTTLTDSLVQKPPAQNAASGTPGTGILPGGGPLGTNNLNASPNQQNAPGTAPANNGAPQPVAVNPAALRRPSDRLNPGDGTAAPTANPQQDPNFIPGLYPPNYNPPNYNPNDPSTWPAITLAPVNPQTGAPGQQGIGGQPGQQNQFGQNGQPVGIPGFGGQGTVPGQQPVTQITAQPFGQQGQGVQPTPLPFGPQPNSGGDASIGLPQPNAAPAQTPSGIPGQGPGQGGFNPQPAQIFNPGLGFAGDPLAPVPTQLPAGFPPFNQTNTQPGQVNPPVQLNPALQAINNQLASPGGPPAVPGGANQQQASPGIAGVASKFEGASIKVYNKRSKYKEWEFVFDPSTGATTAQPANGQNPAGQPGQTPGQPGTMGGAFGLSPNPFAPTSGQTPNQPGQAPSNAAPAPSPFGQAPSPFGQAPNPFAPATQ